jgi:hypothetical protein
MTESTASEPASVHENATIAKAILIPAIWMTTVLLFSYGISLYSLGNTETGGSIAFGSGFALYVLLLASLGSRKLALPPKDPILVHKVAAAAVLYVIPDLLIVVLIVIALPNILNIPIEFPLLAVWFEAAYVLSVIWIFRMYSVYVGMEYVGVFSPLVARWFASKAMERADMNCQISAHCYLTNAYESTSKWLHAKKFESRPLDHLANALSASLNLDPGLSKRSIKTLGSALGKLPNWKATIGILDRLKMPSDIVWTQALTVKKRRSAAAFNALSNFASLLGIILPFVLAGSVAQTQLNDFVGSLDVTYALTILSVGLFALCVAYGKRVWGTFSYGLNFRLAVMKRAEERTHKVKSSYFFGV